MSFTATKPTHDVSWATNDVTNSSSGQPNKHEPSIARKAVGFDYKNFIPRQFLNWMFNAYHAWLVFFDAVTIELDTRVVALETSGSLAAETAARIAADAAVTTAFQSADTIEAGTRAANDTALDLRCDAILGIATSKASVADITAALNLSIPLGTVLDFAGDYTKHPNRTHFYECNGQSLSQTTYAALFAIIGTTYGTGSMGGQFNLPNLNGRSTVGVGFVYDDRTDTHNFTLGETRGELFHQLLLAEMPTHNHAIQTDSAQYGTGGNQNQTHGVGTNTTGNAGSDVPHNNIPPILAMTKVIRVL